MGTLLIPEYPGMPAPQRGTRLSLPDQESWLATRGFQDRFTRARGDTVRGGWTQLYELAPTNYDPVGILDNGLGVGFRIHDTRPGPETSSLPHPPPAGELYSGIGGAVRNFGTTEGRCKVRWAGWRGFPDPTGHEAEGTPLVHWTTSSTRGGIGAWPVAFGGATILLVGYIAKPPELFEVVDTAAIAHVDGTPRDVEVRTTGTTYTVWLDDAQVSLTSAGLTPLAVPAELQGSTLHGFAGDCHLIRPLTDMALWPFLTRFEFMPL